MNTSAERRREFQRALLHEARNRAFALQALTTLSTNTSDPDHSFWVAYWELERLNQEKYRAVARKFDIDASPGLMSTLKARLFLLSNRLARRHTAQAMHQAIVRYLAKLERMRDVADDEEQPFCDYTVAQERAQAEANALLLSGRRDDAVRHLANFVAEAR